MAEQGIDNTGGPGKKTAEKKNGGKIGVWQLGVDIGGTFTDIVLSSRQDQGLSPLFTTKILTSHHAPQEAIIEGVGLICRENDINPEAISLVIHGTTLATNALIERRGAKTAFITTEGFRDVIEMRTESRFEQYDLNITLPPPLIARNHRYTLAERMDADGGVVKAPDKKAMADLAAQLIAENYTSIAIGFLHAYANPAHELAMREAIEQAISQNARERYTEDNKQQAVMISLSSETAPQMREYERFNTVIANAYIKPLMKSYLSRLQDSLAAIGIAAPICLMHSGGGILDLETAAEFPVRLVESGPAGGAIFAADIAARHSLKRVLSFDMGGTTAKICLIRNAVPDTARVFEVARSWRFKKGSGMPISIPVIDMVEIGAGGGSIASLDAMRQITVGPASAGSTPGPACYDRGGTKPTVTDADLILGRLDADDFAGGSIRLSTTAAEQALETTAMTAAEAAIGIAEVVDENMANAARVHAVENGEDLAGYAMIAFGGAAPVHAGRLAQKLGIDHLIVPPGAGVGSAIGFLRAPFSFEATRTRYSRLNETTPQQVAEILSAMTAEASGFVRACDAETPIRLEYKAWMRYRGQGWEIPVPVGSRTERAEQAAGTDTPQHHTPQPDSLQPDDLRPNDLRPGDLRPGDLRPDDLRPDDLRRAFETRYQQLFGRLVDGLEIDITGWACLAATETEPPTASSPISKLPEPAGNSETGNRQVYDPAVTSMMTSKTLARDAMRPGQTLGGPAIITERETSIIVPTGFTATMLQDGCVSIYRDGSVNLGGQNGAAS